MASSLIGGLIADGFSAQHISVSEPQEERRAQLRAHFAIEISDDNRAIYERSDVVVLAVKPQMMHRVCSELQENALSNRRLCISIAAGLRIKDIDGWLGGGNSIIRAMPNTPALIRTGATALYANEKVDAPQRETAESILRAVGLTLWVKDEEELNAVTALSGSGPAYYFLFTELLQNAGVEMGLSKETSRLLALQTAFGASKMALESPDECATLRAGVTSPGGTTERAIDILMEGKVDELFSQALTGARDRAAELADQLGEM